MDDPYIIRDVLIDRVPVVVKIGKDGLLDAVWIEIGSCDIDVTHEISDHEAVHAAVNGWRESVADAARDAEISKERYKHPATCKCGFCLKTDQAIKFAKVIFE